LKALWRASEALTGDGARRLPRSLRGTEVDGGLTLDADGRFVADRDAVAMFEYFLTAVGEESYEDVVARITAEIGVRLPADAADGALAFLTQYLDYRTRAGTLVDVGEPVALAQGFERLRALRREVFDEPLASELFGEEERHAAVTLLQREIATDPDLDDETRRALIEQAFDALPAEHREARARATAHLDLARAQAKLLDEGAGADDIRHERERRFGEDAADRLEALDRRRAEWNARVADYRGARERIDGDASLSDADKGRLVEELLDDAFSDSERTRVEALDRMPAAR
jgi:lipase chaperone LimK